MWVRKKHTLVSENVTSTLYNEQNGAFLESFPPKITRWKFAQVHPTNKEQIESKPEKPLNRCKRRTHITDACTSLLDMQHREYTAAKLLIMPCLSGDGTHVAYLSEKEGSDSIGGITLVCILLDHKTLVQLGLMALFMLVLE
jgi:hypothetical protein